MLNSRGTQKIVNHQQFPLKTQIRLTALQQVEFQAFLDCTNFVDFSK
jgi:hypothetical protein